MSAAIEFLVDLGLSSITVTVSSIRCTVYCIRRDCRRGHLESILFGSIIVSLVSMRWELHLFADTVVARAGALVARLITRETLGVTGTVRSQIVSASQHPTNNNLNYHGAFQSLPSILNECLAWHHLTTNPLLSITPCADLAVSECALLATYMLLGQTSRGDHRGTMFYHISY